MLRSAWSFIVTVVATGVIATGAIVHSVFRGKPADLRPATLWSRVILRSLGARVEYEGLEHRPTDRPCVFVSNHQSNADIWAIVPALPKSTKFVAKASLFRIPFIGWAMRRSGFVPIERQNRTQAIQSLRNATKVIRAGSPVILFPEGTRSRDGRLAAFKKGPFHLALQAGVPVVPLTVRGTHRLLSPGGWNVRPGPVVVRFLEAVDPTRYLPDDHRGLSAEVRRRIADDLGEPAPSTDRSDRSAPARSG